MSPIYQASTAPLRHRPVEVRSKFEALLDWWREAPTSGGLTNDVRMLVRARTASADTSGREISQASLATAYIGQRLVAISASNRRPRSANRSEAGDGPIRERVAGVPLEHQIDRWGRNVAV